MKVLIVASYNYGKYSPFVSEQAESVQGLNIQIDYFPVKGKGVFGYLKNRKELLKKIEKYIRILFMHITDCPDCWLIYSGKSLSLQLFMAVIFTPEAFGYYCLRFACTFLLLIYL